ncbi:hypothetical protein [Pseudomonas amygdali]|uniref:Uncharacterized protein n=2 Tax=Pseudomonas amygdali pv. lachrymans TaxID=53707 RepID=A0ABR5KU19_PSEAV|nr:hypothetical protein [Pseudomonas amygdali]AXH59762.1 hypothetical protein PLA107_031560 [Pseudomonas amygdali pv. lachrymans str. M301315]KPC17185.1 Uncharacterized protein AC499_0387 [Pseudomonas amygdali pv. lachrymans]KPC18144.1 Uncharacterized protein AC499_1346 [Pseudomonas amygdali pv. lachrymans]RMT06487.1 hypothetical protein ALP54_03662 [Pseudomonas amygdali pv. lachrymans]
MKPFRTDLSITEEIQAVADFLALKWEPVDNLAAIVQSVQKAAFHDGRAAIDGAEVGGFISDIMRRRADMIQGMMDNPVEKMFATMFDGPMQVLITLSSHARQLAEVGLNVDGKWDYERQVRAAQIRAERDFPGLATAAPAGWQEFKNRVKDGKVNIDYSLADEKVAFAGSMIETCRSLGLVEQLALHNLQYGDEEQGRKPQYALISAIYSHFSNIQLKMVSHELMVAIDRMTDWDVPEHRFGTPALNDSGNVFAKLLISKVGEARQESEFRQAVESKLEFDAKPEEERNAIQQTNRDRMKSEMTPAYWKAMDEQIKREEASALVDLREAFGIRKFVEPESPSL